MKKTRFLIITGMSGAGKTLVLRVLEDLDYFCVDNFPPELIPKFAEIYPKLDKSVALVVDARVGSFFAELTMVLNDLKNRNFAFELLFLNCSDAKIIARYKETRRRHPLATEERISNGIALEKEMLSVIKSFATNIIDTSDTSATDLRNVIKDLYGTDSNEAVFSVNIVSFGFKYGVPLDADMVFDVRFLTNPFYVTELKKKSGLTEEVGKYILSSPVSTLFLDKLYDFVEFLLPQYVKEGKSQLVIAIGCTGGMHRSVFVTERLAEKIKKFNYKVRVEHRDLIHNERES